MKKILFFAFVLALLAQQVEAQQNRTYKPLTGWRYQNGASYGSTTADTLSSTTADTVFFGVVSGERYPTFVIAMVQLTNTTGDADTVAVYWDRGVGGLFVTDTPQDTLIKSISTTATVGRTFTTDLTNTLALAQALGNNKNGATGFRARIAAISVPATARVQYKLKLIGVYDQ